MMHRAAGVQYEFSKASYELALREGITLKETSFLPLASAVVWHL